MENCQAQQYDTHTKDCCFSIIKMKVVMLGKKLQQSVKTKSVFKTFVSPELLGCVVELNCISFNIRHNIFDNFISVFTLQTVH